MTITTDRHFNFGKAQNDTFSWSRFDGANGDYLTHKPSGRMIYQMTWVVGGKWTGPVEGDVRAQAIKFWEELAELQAARAAEMAAEVADEVDRDAPAMRAHAALMSRMDDPNSDM